MESRIHAAVGCVYRGAIEAKRMLWDSGWMRSRLNGMTAQDASGDPLPWLTYPAIRWLDGYVDPGMSVFEWGSGQSTRWFRWRGCRVTSIEHDPRFVRPGITLARGIDAYVGALDHGKHDLVLIDGEWRVECAIQAAQLGCRVVMLDNADSYTLAASFLRLRYKHAIPFRGLAPGYTEIETHLFLDPKPL